MNANVKIAFLIVVVQFLLQSQKLDYPNLLFLAVMTVGVFLIKSKETYIYTLARHTFLLASIIIQFIFEEYTITKDLFINCLYILLLFKLLETKNNNYFFLLSLCIFLTVSNLINNQNIISSVLGASSSVLIVILLYQINQKEFVSINLGNLKRFLIIILVTVPTIIITYLIFPRTEVNISLFNNKIKNLGIPDKISLGTFQDITQDDQIVFSATFKQSVKQKNLYFRVKTFSFLDAKKDWLPINTQLIFKDNLSYKAETQLDPDFLDYSIIIEGHDKNWVPVLDYALPNNDKYYNFYNFTYKLDKKIIKKNKFIFRSQSNPPFQDISSQAKSYYLQLPSTVSSKFQTWAMNNKKNQSDLSYLNSIMRHFKENDYFYNLSPQPIGNNYGKFFFESKEGYCEYFAGTLTILARAAGIPARIVTGFYGGQYNNYGDFYSFAQEDAHSWVEAWVEGSGWVRFDPTQVIPLSRIRSNINNFQNNNSNSETKEENIFKIFNNNALELWVRYANYQWENFLLNYDSVERNKFLNDLTSLDKNTIVPLILNLLKYSILTFLLITILLLIKRKDFSDILFFIIIKKFNLTEKKFETHQNIFKKLDSYLSLKFILQEYEKAKFYDKHMSFVKFIRNSYKILRCKKI
jgi:transglutaminase-like putative cysteine protease